MKPPLSRIPADIAAVEDYERYARERMSEQAWAWLSGGAADEQTLRDNREAFARLRLMPRVLAEVAGGHTRLRLFGCELEHPLLLAPVAYQQLVHPEGERASVLAAGAMKAGMVVSTQSGISLDELAREATAPLWFQLYIQPDREFTAKLVRRAEAAGYRALVVTVDAPVAVSRNREQRAGFTLPAGISAVNLEGMRTLPPESARPGEPGLFASRLLAAAPTWKDLDWLCRLTELPVLVKGVLSPTDALRALETGAAGVVVSNHGGRVLDGVPATLDALPAVAEAVGGHAPVLLDGGVRRGTDVLKALALGASAVLIGRPYVHALAAAGAVGVAHVLHLLRTELEAAMALTGCRSLAEVDASILWPPRSGQAGSAARTT